MTDLVRNPKDRFSHVVAHEMLSKASYLIFFSSSGVTHCLLGNFSCFLSSGEFFQSLLFEKILSGISSECQTVWTLIRPDNSSGLI